MNDWYGMSPIEVALMGILKKHDLLSNNPAWDEWANPPVKTWNHQVVGEIGFVE